VVVIQTFAVPLECSTVVLSVDGEGEGEDSHVAAAVGLEV
jgi:hypothetical protein